MRNGISTKLNFLVLQIGSQELLVHFVFVYQLTFGDIGE